MQRKRLRSTSGDFNSKLAQVFSVEKPPALIIRGSKTTGIDEEKIYYRSDPIGADKRDKPMSLWNLSNLLCPVVKYRIKHNGFNFGGGHWFAPQNIPGGGGIDGAVALVEGLDTDSRRFVLNVSAVTNQVDRREYADTIAFNGGTQAWYESLSLPGTWNAQGGAIGEKHMPNQPSLLAFINAQSIVRSPWDYFNTAHGNESAQPGAQQGDRDYTIRYNGGSQKHTFINHSENDVMYELWELAPRNIERDWITSLFDPQSEEARCAFNNIHNMVSYSYAKQFPVDSTATANDFAVNNISTYLAPSQSTGLASVEYINPNGQQIRNKNDPGFRINKNCIDLYHKFKVSKSRKGTIKPGSVMVYDMKHGPFEIKNSTWLRLVTGNNDGSTARPYDSTNFIAVDNQHPHLVPICTKIFCIRFWGEIGNLNNTADADQGLASGVIHNYKYITTVPGVILHQVQETHDIRVVPYTQNINVIQKDFTSTQFENGQNTFKVINDESNSQQTTQLN